ncbi:hypothetical protein JXA84_01185, partial [candidate division WOR-3 bacterium]|nr:hypothetical protein [candidate division WOR-3 bacterium]
MKTLHNTVFIAIMLSGFIGLVKSNGFTQFILVACVTLAVFLLYFLFFMKLEAKRQKKEVQDEIDKSINLLRSFPDNFYFKIFDNISG